MWSKCPWVARTATGRLPSASTVPFAPISQQLDSNELSEKTSRYIGRSSYPMNDGPSGGPAGTVPLELGGVDPERDGAVVHELDLHVLSEGASSHGGAPSLERPGEGLDAGEGHLGRRSAVPGGSASPTDAPVQRELRDDEELAVDVGHGAVHLALGVLEHTEVDDLLGQAVVFAEPVLAPDADEEQEPGADLRDQLTADAHRRARHALEQDPHRGTTRKAS